MKNFKRKIKKSYSWNYFKKKYGISLFELHTERLSNLIQMSRLFPALEYLEDYEIINRNNVIDILLTESALIYVVYKINETNFYEKSSRVNIRKLIEELKFKCEINQDFSLN
ncbi:hypothetical protein G6R40_01185 [Chryseobacterium sp. POL2]|uniref:hypothetical protein n=1 Tax=Chryseobacterium sp. POL2 TaxID=2713414 RepID=UPI0013E1AD66|nr:hypothetical protein [Chryseobacterium sp. POL2]QIG88352.1 hypothetical protein G6R40_01185 [Chryseobacterium sp. POL2]